MKCPICKELYSEDDDLQIKRTDWWGNYTTICCVQCENKITKSMMELPEYFDFMLVVEQLEMVKKMRTFHDYSSIQSELKTVLEDRVELLKKLFTKVHNIVREITIAED